MGFNLIQELFFNKNFASKMTLLNRGIFRLLKYFHFNLKLHFSLHLRRHFHLLDKSKFENKYYNIRIHRNKIKPLSLFLLFYIVLNCGCMKKESDKIDYGPEVNKDKMSSALKDALGTTTSVAIKQGDFVQTDTSRIIRGRDKIDLLQSVGLSVVKKVESPSQWQMNLVEEKVTYDLTGAQPPKKLLREYSDCISKINGKAVACEITFDVNNFDMKNMDAEYKANSVNSVNSSYPDQMLALNEFILFDTKEKTAEDPPKVTFHKLQVKKYLGDPPVPVRDSKDCGGIPNCKLNLTELQFDQVYWNKDGTADKIHVKIITSKEVPYLANPVEKCQQGSIPVPQKGEDPKNAPRLLVTFCETVRNFQKGE